jgi:carboxylesterase type B
LLKYRQVPAASRNFTIGVFDQPEPTESEDCLYLNVFAPSKPPPFGGYAVMFWIYGGALEFGNAGQPTYDGSGFAAFEEVIVVTTNYLTNGKSITPIYQTIFNGILVFGFPNSPELPLTGQNLGFLDQRAALKWVQRNIWAFGGNPKKVTIFGQSSGAESVDALVTSLPHNPPFWAAILESGTVALDNDLTLGLNSTVSWLSLVSALNCSQKSFSSDLACVRAAKATTIQNIIELQALIFQPVHDGVTLINNPNAARAAGNVARVPVLTGSNGQEGRVFEFGLTNLTAYIQETFGAVPAIAAEVATAYAVGTDGTTNGFEAISQIFTELVFQCVSSFHIANWTLFAVQLMICIAPGNYGQYQCHSRNSCVALFIQCYLPQHTTRCRIWY